MRYFISREDLQTNHKKLFQKHHTSLTRIDYHDSIDYDNSLEVQ